MLSVCGSTISYSVYRVAKADGWAGPLQDRSTGFELILHAAGNEDYGGSIAAIL